MIKCPLCDLTTGHSHFSYDIAEYVDDLRNKLDELSTAIEDFIAYIKQGEKEKAHLQMLVVETYLAEINRIGGKK